MKMRFRFLSSCALALTAVSLCTGCEDVANNVGMTTTQPTLLRIETVSNRADHVSGGDVMVQIFLPPDATTDGLHVTAGDRDVTSEFPVRSDGRILGIIRGLAEGDTKVVADVAGAHTVSLTITNYSLGGPVFSGTRVKPFICATPTEHAQQGDIPASNASGLASEAVAGDDNCNLKTEVKLFYRSNIPTCANVEPDPSQPATPDPNACFKPYDETAPAPADLAMISSDGAMVPYIVRDERGTVNRGVYDIAVLFNPKADPKATGWNPFAPQKGWNGKVVYSFGANSGQPRQQFRSEQHWNDEDSALSQGFMVAFNSMTDSKFNSNRTLMTETLMMMKEKIIDNYGEIKYMIGDGCSGGSINQITAASIYPGLLDGIQPTCTYPDSESTAIEVVDCLQLVHAFSSKAWTDEMTRQSIDNLPADFAKRTAIAGHLDPLGCITWVLAFADGGKPGQFVPRSVDANGKLVDPKPGAATTNNCSLPESMVYNKDTNPTGVRCGAADNAVAVFGKVKDGSRARTTTDNVGIQYGLKALTDGAITAEEFVIINEQAGGVDADADFTAERSAGDPDALAIAYRSGIVSDGKHLAKLPILDTRGYDESGIHQAWRSLALRARLDDANGNHKNLVLWRHQLGLALPSNHPIPVEGLSLMDKWITAIKGDASGDPIEDVVVANKPKDLFDFCYLTSDTMLTKKVTDVAMCDADARLKMHASPRQIAGGPVSENILKCDLKPLDPKDYAPAVLTAAQIDRLDAVFPKGVCDFTKPGIGQQDSESPLNFTAGPGGTPVGTPPSTKNGS